MQSARRPATRGPERSSTAKSAWHQAIGRRAHLRTVRELKTRIGRQVSELRLDAGVSIADLARCADVDPSHVWRIEAGSANASLDVLVALASCLGSDLGLRFFATAAPRLRDRFQAPMIEALIRHLGPAWRTRPEVPIPAVRGVVDLVLNRALDHLTIVCECHSELRRLELALRRANEKAEAVQRLEGAQTASTILLLRSTEQTRRVVRAYEATFRAAFPGRLDDALSALQGDAAWPGSTLL